MEPNYQVENGGYAFYLKGEKLFSTDEVSILFDAECFVLLKHGSPDFVQQEFQRMREALSKSKDGLTLLSCLQIVQGKFDIDELNKAINASGYLSKLMQQLSTGSTDSAGTVIKQSTTPAT